MHKQSWFLEKMQDICSKYCTWLQKLVLNLVSWMLYQVFSLLTCLGVVKDKRLSCKFEKFIQQQRLIHYSVKRRTHWEMRRTLVSTPEITPTYDCGALLLGAVLIFYLYRKKKLKLHEVSIESNIILASSKEGVTRNLLLLLAMSMEMYRIWHEASLVEMRENHYVMVFKELQMAGDVELNPGPYPPELLARLMDDFAELMPEYSSLGVQLKVPDDIIEKIKNDTGNRLVKIFDHWLHNNQEDVWFEQLYTALQRMHKSDLTIIVQQKYINKSTKDATLSDEARFVSDVIEAVDQNQQIQRKMANIILKGLPETGKSTLLNRLLGRPFRKSYFSTGISDGVVVVDIQPTSTLIPAIANDNSSWNVIDFDASMYSQLEDSKQFLSSAEVMPIKENPVSYQVHNVSSTSEVPNNIKKVLSAHNIKSIKDLKMKNSLYIRDTGGQVEFQESLTLHIYGPSIFIFVLRTDIDINKKTIIQYRAPSGKIINRYQSSISTVDALVQFLTSVSAIETTTEDVFQEGGVYRSHKPIVFIVGTHIDKLGSRASSVIAKINECLDKLIQQHNFSNVICYANHFSPKVMYTVDNTCKEDDNFKVLRRDVNKFIGRREFTVLYPVSYLLSCLELQNIKDTVISMDQFKQLASKFNVTSDQVNHLLQFLQFRIGIIQHYDADNLSDIVIKEPQVLFNKVTDLLVKTFLTGEAMTDEESFCQKGILEASSFENIMGESNDKITAEQFLAFMVHLRLAVPFKDKNKMQKYFIPSVLNHVPSSACEERKTDIAPLCICFELGHCPQGLFCVLISHLVSPEKSHVFSFDLSEDKIYQDQVSVLINSSEDDDEISLKRHLSRIEVTMYLEGCSDTESESFLAPRSMTPTAVCTTIRSILQECLQLSLKTLHYDIEKLQPMFCLACPISNCPVKMHEVRFGRKSCFMRCTFSKSKIEVSSFGLYWFNGGAPNTAEGLEAITFISPGSKPEDLDSSSQVSSVVLPEVSDSKSTSLQEAPDDTPAVSSSTLSQEAPEASNTVKKEKPTSSPTAPVVPPDDTDTDEPGIVSSVIKAVNQNKRIKKKMANIILKGLPGAGKTMLLDRLLNKPIKESYTSTGVCEGIVTVEIRPTATLNSVTGSGSNWQVTDLYSSVSSQLEDEKQFFLPSAEEMAINENSGNSPPTDHAYRISSTSEVSDNIKKVLRAHNIKNIKDLETKSSLYIRDTGGQVEFQESLTLFINGPSIFMFVLRTDIDITKKNTIQYRKPNSNIIINKYKSSISTENALVQFLTSVSAIKTTNKDAYEEGIYHEPIVFIVGTHIDNLKSGSTKIDEINVSLYKLITNHNFTNVVHCANLDSSRVMYPVNNKCDSEDDIFDVLRTHVNMFIDRKNMFQMEIPVSYLLSCLELQKINDTVISKDEFKKLASKFNIKSDQVNRLLQFLHFRIGIIQHYDVDNLSDIVIKEPQVLFNKVTELLVKTFISPQGMDEEERTSVCNKGILDAEILGQSNDMITTEQFLEFMVHLRLAVPFEDKKGNLKYFIPSVLNHVPPSAGEEGEPDISPLCICFELGHCPQGLFGVLISHLVNPDETCDILFELIEDEIYQDQISLQVKSADVDEDQVTLKKHLSHIEVIMYIQGCSGAGSVSKSRGITPAEVCTRVHSILQVCLQRSLNTLHYDTNKLKPKYSLKCHNSGCPMKRHEVVMSIKEFKFFMNCKFTKKKEICRCSELYWFIEGNSNSRASNLEKKCESISSKGTTSGASNTAVSLESALKQSTAIASPGITKDGSKATAKLQKYISDIQEQYQKHLDEQIDSEIICDVAKHLHSWDAKYNLLNLDYDKVKVIKEENSSSVMLQRITALNHWKDRVGPDCTYRNLLRILALGDWHDSANKVITFINNGSCHRQIAHSSSSQQWEGREPANKKEKGPSAPEGVSSPGQCTQETNKVSNFIQAVLISSVVALALAGIISLAIAIFTQTSLTTHPSVTSSSSTTATPFSTRTPARRPANFSLASKPEIRELLLLECGHEVLDIVAQVAFECNKFGIHLGLESHIVNNEWDVPGHAESRCQNIVEQWLKGRGKKGSKGKPVTWRTIVEALRSVGHNELADSLSKC